MSRKNSGGKTGINNPQEEGSLVRHLSCFPKPCPDPKPLLDLVRSLALCPRKELPGAHMSQNFKEVMSFMGQEKGRSLLEARRKKEQNQRSLPSSSRGTETESRVNFIYQAWLAASQGFN